MTHPPDVYHSVGEASRKSRGRAYLATQHLLLLLVVVHLDEAAQLRGHARVRLAVLQIAYSFHNTEDQDSGSTRWT